MTGALAASLLLASPSAGTPGAGSGFRGGLSADTGLPAGARAADAGATVLVDADTTVLLDGDGLARRLDRILRDPALARAHVGMKVTVAETGEVLYERAAERRFVPASNVKLVTAAAALDVLGPEHRWATRLHAAGPVRDGTLEGDLWIVGDGDPRLTRERVDRWPGLLARAGIRRVAGDVVADDRAFAGPPWPEGWTWGDLHSGWGVGSTALQLHPGRVRGRLVPGDSVGDPARLQLPETGPPPAMELRVRTGAPGSRVRLRFSPPTGRRAVRLSGWIPEGGDPVRLSLAPARPTRQLLDYLEARLREDGPPVDGEFRRAGPSERRPEATWSTTLRSDPLETLLPRMLRRSDNQIAESLLRSVGREAGGEGSPGEGIDAAVRMLGEWGVDPDAVHLTDGSGLSRYDQLTPAGIVRMLRALWLRPGFEDFARALPEAAGEEGTLTGRLLGTPAQGNLRGKTGSLSGVRALSGYVEDGAGRTLVFSLLVNGYHGPGDVAVALEDLLVEQLALLRRPVVPGWPEYRKP